MSASKIDQTSTGSNDQDSDIFFNPAGHFNHGAQMAIRKSASEYETNLRKLSSDIASKSSDDVQERHVLQARSELVATQFDFIADFATVYILPGGYMLLGMFIPEFLNSFGDDKQVGTLSSFFGISGGVLIASSVTASVIKAPIRRRLAKKRRAI